MYATKPKKKRYLIKNMLDELYDWAVETWDENYAKITITKGSWQHGEYGDPDECEVTNQDDFYNDIHHSIRGNKWEKGELKEEFESEIRSCMSHLSDKDAERIIKWMGLSIDNEWYDYPRDGLEDDDDFIEAITKKFIYRKLNIKEKKCRMNK